MRRSDGPQPWRRLFHAATGVTVAVVLHVTLPSDALALALLGAALALLIALGVSSLVKSLLLKRLLKAPVSNWRWALVWAVAPAVVVGYVMTLLPEWMELAIGIPAILATYGYVIWKRGFGPEDRVLFSKNAAKSGDAAPQ